MREIKFRAWIDKVPTNDKMFHTTSRKDFENDESIYSWGTVEEANGNIMQYTGLKDKNGVEIYEGDIVPYIEYNNKTVYGEIVYNESMSMFGVEYIDDNECFFASLSHQENDIQDWIEVIGNIYENKDLL